MNVLDERFSDEQLAEIVIKKLSSRELHILHLVALGKTTKQISYALGLSNRSIDAHRYNLRGKLKIRGVAELAILGWRIRDRLRVAAFEASIRDERVEQDALTT